MSTRGFHRSFAGGEVSPEFWGQFGDAKFQTGLALCRNFIVQPHGPLRNRTGTQFVRQAKLADVRLIPFEFSSEQTLLLEFGAGYVRFHTMGATVEATPGNPYEVATAYAAADLPDIHFVQSADVLTLVHPGHPVRELRRLGATNWTVTDVAFAPTVAAPGAPTATATTAPSPNNTRPYSYVVAAIAGGEESTASVAATCTNNLDQTGAYNSLTWPAVAGAERYAVYRTDIGSTSGPFGYVGDSASTSFRDDNIAPDMAKTPASGTDPFAAAGDRPAAVTYYEQRRVFAGTLNQPQNVWATRSATERNMNASVPPRDDDAVRFRIAARQVNRIRHLVPLGALIALTDSGEFRIESADGGALTPTNAKPRPQSAVGASNVQPVLVDSNLIFAAARGGHLREMAYNNDAGGYLTGDLSLRASHLFDDLRIKALAYAKAPIPVVWVVSSDGRLLGFTYVPDQQVGAWHQHDTGAGDTFLDVCVVAEGTEDAVYVAVRRTVGGAARTYIERFAARAFAALADAVYTDSSLTYTGAPATTISGLSHLEGRTVAILADGAVHPRRVVSGGQVALDHAASKVTAGLPIEADLQTLPMVIESMGAFGQGRPKNITRAWLRVRNSSGLQVGPSFDKLVPHKQRRNEPMGTAPAPVTDEIEFVPPSSWQSSGQVCVRQADPLPATVVALCLEAAVGG